MDFSYHGSTVANIEVKNFHSPVPASGEYDVCRGQSRGLLSSLTYGPTDLPTLLPPPQKKGDLTRLRNA